MPYDPQTAALVFLILVGPLALAICWTDLRYMKIPNKINALILLIFLVAGLIVLPFDIWAWRWVNFIVVLAVGFSLNLAFPFGAGDAKYLAVAAPFIDPAHTADVFYLFSTCLLASLAVHRTLRAIPAVRRMAPDWVSWVRKDFPMGLAISGTLILYLAFVAFPGIYGLLGFSKI